MKILIKNGVVISPSQKLEKKLDILIEGKFIKKIGHNLKFNKEVELINANQCIVSPGIIDIHTHLREPGYEDKETIATGTKAAAAGGITTLFCMPNTQPVIDNQATVEFVILKTQNEGVVNVLPVGAITKGLKGEELSEIGELKKTGVVAISDDGRCVMNSKIMLRALEYSKMFDLPIISHCEDENLSKGGSMNEGKISTLLGVRGIPKEAEEIMVVRDLILAALSSSKLHITHVSTRNSVYFIKMAKKYGINVSCDTAPHYFTLTEDALKGSNIDDIYDTNKKINPPLRTKEDVDAILRGIIDGTIDCIASDHAPHTQEEKNKEFDVAPFGIIGLETLLPLCVTKLYHERKVPVIKILEKLVANPAKIFKLNRGNIDVGEIADIVIFNPNEEFTVKNFVSKSSNSPFIGWKLKGKVKYTICDGKIVYKEKQDN